MLERVGATCVAYRTRAPQHAPRLLCHRRRPHARAQASVMGQGCAPMAAASALARSARSQSHDSGRGAKRSGCNLGRERHKRLGRLPVDDRAVHGRFGKHRQRDAVDARMLLRDRPARCCRRQQAGRTGPRKVRSGGAETQSAPRGLGGCRRRRGSRCSASSLPLSRSTDRTGVCTTASPWLPSPPAVAVRQRDLAHRKSKWHHDRISAICRHRPCCSSYACCITRLTSSVE